MKLDFDNPHTIEFVIVIIAILFSIMIFTLSAMSFIRLVVWYFNFLGL